VTLPDKSVLSVNYYCTRVPQTATGSHPVIWFTSSPAHGVVDFLGLQQELASSYGRNSCSFDPPNFGWSSPLPSSRPVSFDVLPYLLESTQRHNEDKILAGWAAGVVTALNNTIHNPATVKGLVMMDVAPDGIEWRDQQRAMNWTNEQTLNFRQTDLKGRVTLAELILGLIIPW
jgi:pimeloyl-ACP methyl ester carboxylesterase